MEQTFGGLKLIDLATIMAAAAVFAMLIAIRAALTIRDPMAKRVKALNERRAELKAGITVAPRRRGPIHQTTRTTDWMRSLLGGLKVLQDQQLQQAQIKLAHAGIRTKDGAVAVIFGRLVLPIVIGGTCVTGIYVLDWFQSWGGLKRYLFVATSLIVSYKAPDLYIDRRARNRTAAIRNALPDAVDLLVICAEAGLTVDAAFTRVAKELGQAHSELADEMTLTAIELGFLTDRRQAFENFASRIDLEWVRGLVTTLIQTERFGTPLAGALRTLAAEYRHARMMRAEEKAARLPAIMTVPLIVFILPTLFIVILGPAACSISDNMLKG
jgi:tight adherence protein C